MSSPGGLDCSIWILSQQHGYSWRKRMCRARGEGNDKDEDEDKDWRAPDFCERIYRWCLSRQIPVISSSPHCNCLGLTLYPYRL
ncbi:hypothetical protein BST61_g9531 [Cercospora zeina]